MQQVRRIERQRALASPVLAVLLASCASASTSLERLPQPLVVTVQEFEPHWFFDGNQMNAWVEFTFAVEQGNRSPIRVVSILDWSENFEVSPNGKTLLSPQVNEERCPVLRADGTRYRIKTRFERILHRDVPGAHLLLTSCTPIDGTG